MDYLISDLKDVANLICKTIKTRKWLYESIDESDKHFLIRLEKEISLKRIKMILNKYYTIDTVCKSYIETDNYIVISKLDKKTILICDAN